MYIELLLSVDITGRGVWIDTPPLSLPLSLFPSPSSLLAPLSHSFYAAVRQAVGLEVILGALSFATKKSPKELHVLDTGTHAS